MEEIDKLKLFGRFYPPEAVKLLQKEVEVEIRIPKLGRKCQVDTSTHGGILHRFVGKLICETDELDKVERRWESSPGCSKRITGKFSSEMVSLVLQ